MLRQLPGSAMWVYQCQINGKKWCRSTGTADRGQAEKIAVRLQRQAALLRQQPDGLPTLKKAILAEVGRVETDVGARQAERVGNALKNFLAYLGKDLSLDRIDAGMVERYQRKRLGEVAAATVHKELSCILRLLRLNGFLVARPAAKRGKATPQRAFTAEELTRFFAACSLRDRLLYGLMLATGARLAELMPSKRSSHVPLLKTEVDLDGRRITLRSAKARPGAAGKVRVLPLPEGLVEPLRRHIEETRGEHVFTYRVNVRRDFEDTLRRAGIAKKDALGHKVTSHSFRHTYATLASEAIGHNPFLLKAILGHTQLSTTDRYCHPAAPVFTFPVTFKEEGGVEGRCKVLTVRGAA